VDVCELPEATDNFGLSLLSPSWTQSCVQSADECALLCLSALAKCLMCNFPSNVAGYDMK